MGISFPFRISNSGGVATSTVSTVDISHIIEKIKIVLTTYVGDRTMEQGYCSQVDTLVFKDNETATHTLLEYHVENALRQLQDVISVSSVRAHGEGEYMYVDIKFKLLEYDRVYSLSNVKVGEITNE
jgi:phage baseplate assembly protein W